MRSARRTRSCGVRPRGSDGLAAVAFTVAAAGAWPVAGVACAVPAALLAVGRVQAGAHYPSDVAAGAAIGVASAWLAVRTPRLVVRSWLL
ncbi:phosphatase PAP2 family protein (plasmid) [Streptomyces sp. C1-1]|uniref:phosphatase PAP2 family protein n=1 Tax=Streptomyces sp. C1-1 TaxID=3231173 RepID=UPI003CFDABF0